MTGERSAAIGIVLKGYPRLSETFIVREILMLEDLGHRLHIFALRDPRDAAVHDDVKRVRAGVTYVPDRLWGALLEIARSNLTLWRRRPGVYARALGFALARSARERDPATLKRFLQAAHLARLTPPGNGVAHLHAHFAHDPTTVAFFASWLGGLPYSFSAHAKDIFVQDPDWLREKIRRARFVVTCTEHNRAYLANLAGDPSRILRSYHGVRPVVHRPAAHPDPPAVPRLLSVGRLVPKKGFPVLLEALAMLERRGVAFQCSIVGGGPLASSLRDRVAALRLTDRVALLAPMSQAELMELYRSTDVFVLASEIQADGDRDGIPNVIVEAMAMGIPVISTRVSGIPECVEDGVTGLLVPERDPSALADAIARLLETPALARAYGCAARRKIESEFDSTRTIRAIDAALREATGDAVEEEQRAVGA